MGVNTLPKSIDKMQTKTDKNLFRSISNNIDLVYTLFGIIV